MGKCTCYNTIKKYYSPVGWEDVGICNGTKERDECSCEGNMSKCDFYPEVREKAKKELNTAEMWLAAQEDGETYKTDFLDSTYSKTNGFFANEKYKYVDTPTLNDWMNAMWRKQEKRKLTREEAEKEFDIKIVD